MSVPDILKAQTFQTVPDSSEFVFDSQDLLDQYKLLGAVRSVTSGDYDSDGDDDIFVTRFASERLDEKQPQFIFYENLTIDGGNPQPLKFRVRRYKSSAPSMLINVRGLRFTRVNSSLIEGSHFPSGVTADFNFDGRPDLFIGGAWVNTNNATHNDVTERSLLFINCGGWHFEEVGDWAGLNDADWVCQGGAVADYNRDGWPDIFMASTDQGHSTEGTGGRNLLFLSKGEFGTFNYGDSTFTYPLYEDKSNDPYWGLPQKRLDHIIHMFAPTAADFDKDGDIDVYVCERPLAQCDSEAVVLSPNEFYVNQGNGFQDQAHALGVDDTGNGYGTCWGDFNNDGNFDLLVVNNVHPEELIECPGGVLPPPAPGKSTTNVLYRSLGPAQGYHFAIHGSPNFALPIALGVNNGSFFFDYDLDGLQDFFYAVETGEDDSPSSLGIGDLLYRQYPAGVFTEVTISEGLATRRKFSNDTSCSAVGRVPEGTNAMYGDFDLDGDLDMFIGEAHTDGDCHGPGTDGASLVFKNRTRDVVGNHYLSVRLVGSTAVPSASQFGADRSAIGSVVRLYANGGMQSQQVCAGGQDGSTWPSELSFGLGTTTSVDSIAIDWHHKNVPGVPSTPFHQRIDGPIAVNQRLAPITIPSIVAVPNDIAAIQTAVDGAVPGSIVLVQGPDVYPSVMLKPGVRVEAVTGTNPVIDAQGGSTAVAVTQALSASGTALVGFSVRNYATTGIAATGGGTQSLLIENCRLESPSGALTDAISSTETSVRILGTTISFPAGKSGRGAFFVDIPNHDADLEMRNCKVSYLGSTIGGQGVWVQGQYYGSVLIEDNTFYHFDFGIDVTTNRDVPAVLRRNLVLGPGIGSYGIRCYQGPLAATPQLTHNLSWGHTTNFDVNGNTATPTNNLASDPRLCGTDLTLDLTSPAARFGNDWNAWIGVNKYVACASGVLSRTVSVVSSDVRDNALTLTSDLEIASSETLTVGTGLTMKADNTAEAPLGSGIDASKNEIIVHGHLTTGFPGPTITSTASGTNPGYWHGIVVKNGGSANLFSTTIENCVYGLYCPDLAGDVSMTGGTIRRFSQRGIQVNQVGSGSTAKLTVSGCSIDVTDGLTGVLLLGAQAANLNNVTITGDAGSAHGVQIGAIGTGGLQAVVTKSTISGFSTGRGIRVEAGSPVISGNTISDCKWGVELRGSGSPLVVPVTVPTTTKNTITGCTTGMYAGQTVSPLVDRVVIANTSTSAPIAVYTDSISTGSYTGLTITGHQIGFKAFSTAAHSIVKTSITGFGQYGVQIPKAGIVSIGCSSDQDGNSISSGVSGVLKYVSVKTPRLSSLPDICAESNYWGEAPPPASLMGALVDYEPWLTSVPPLMQASAALQIGTEAAPRVFRASPNPFTGSLRFSFSVAWGMGVPVRLEVFDLAGRLIWETQEDALSAGDHEIEWSGRSESGSKVSAGIFFVRLHIGAEQQFLKVVKVQ